MKRCACCGGDTRQDGAWPIKEGPGCLMCWERECAEFWWAVQR